MSSLTAKQEKFMLALMTAPTVTEASKLAGIARSTGQKYLKDITFRRAYRQYRNDIMQQATGKLQNASIRAVEVLEEIMDDKTVSPYARQQAAQTILNMAYKANEQIDMLEMIEELEMRVLDNET
ncbi:replication protein [Streptococcus suis]